MPEVSMRKAKLFILLHHVINGEGQEVLEVGQGLEVIAIINYFLSFSSLNAYRQHQLGK